MKRKPVLNIALAALLALSLTACGEKKTAETTEVPTTKMNALLEKSDLSQVDLNLNNEGFPLPTDESFIGTWSASSADATSFYSIVIGTDMANEETPYTVSIRGYTGENLDTSYEWHLNAKVDPENPNLLVYSKAKKTTNRPMTEEEATALASLSESELAELPEKEPDYTDGSGSFLIQEDNLVWTDDKEKTAWDLFFSKVDEDSAYSDEESASTGSAAPSSSDTQSTSDEPPITNNNGNRLIADDEIIPEEKATWDYDESDYPDEDEEEEIEGEVGTETESETETENGQN